MKVKVFTLTFVIATTAALTALVSCESKADSAPKDITLNRKSDKVTQDITGKENKNKPEAAGKEVRKRGIFYNGGGLGARYWPKSYASHYGYNFQIPPSSGHFASAGAAFPAAYPSYSAVAPPSIAPIPALAPAAAFPAVTAPFLKYPSTFHYKTPFAAVAPAPPPAIVHSHHGQAEPHHVHAAATPFVLKPGGAVVQSYNVNYPQYYHHQSPHTVTTPVQPIQPVHHHVTPIHHLNPVQQIPVAPIAPVHHHHQVTPPVVPVQPVVPASPVFPGNAIFPSGVIPPRPIFPSPSTFAGQKPLFVNFLSGTPTTTITGQFPGVVPLPGTTHNKPESGSADGSPQITTTHSTFPAVSAQTPWKPIFFNPPTTATVSTATVNRPSITLLPPYSGHSQGPESPEIFQTQGPHHQTPQQHHHNRGPADQSNYFDNLTDEEIQQLFAQANFESNLLNQNHKGYHY